MAQIPRLRRGARPPGASLGGAGGAVATTYEEREEANVETLTHAGLTWYHANAPGVAEVAWLRERFGFDELTLEDVLSTRQRPKVDEYPDVVFVILHFPRYDKRTKRLNFAEVNAFVGPDYVITMPTQTLNQVERMFNRCRDDEGVRARHMERGSGYLFFEIVDDLFQYCFPIVDKIAYKLDRLEDDLGEILRDEPGPPPPRRGRIVGRREQPVGGADTAADILSAKLEIINFRRIMKPQRPILNQLDRVITRFLPEDLDVYFDELIDKSERIWDVLEASKERVEALEDTHETLIAYRNNEQLRVLTIISVILLPLTLITGFFGINVRFPGIDTAAGFYGAAAIMLVTLVALVGWFRLRGWL